MDIPDILATGLVDLPWWGYIVVALVLTHVTIAAVTIFLHRAQAHRGLDLHAILSHFFRFWLWLATGQVRSCEFFRYHAYFASNSSVSPKYRLVTAPARVAYSISASVGKR